MPYRNRKYLDKQVKITRDTDSFKDRIGRVSWVESCWIGIELDGFKVGKRVLIFKPEDVEIIEE